MRKASFDAKVWNVFVKSMEYGEIDDGAIFGDIEAKCSSFTQFDENAG